MITGIRDFSGGQTLRERVNAEMSKILALCSGYKADDGALEGDALCDDVTITTAIEGAGLPLTSQTPIVATRGGTSKIICRDKNSAMRVLSNGVWGAAGPTCPIVSESTPVPLGSDQFIFPTTGSDPKLMVYEPEAGIIVAVASAPVAAGSGYTNADVLSLDGGTGGTVTVTVVGGNITAVALTTAGFGYKTGTHTTTGGTGTGCTVSVTTVKGALRPLSFKGPLNYSEAAKPAVTPSVGATITAATIAFVEGGGSADTITDSANGFVAAGFVKGQTITVTGSTSNDGTYVLSAVAADTLTLAVADDLTAEGASATVTITASVGIQLFDCNDGETDWASAAAGVTPTTSNDSVSIEIAATVAANLLIAKKDLGSTGISPTGKMYLVLDIAIEDDAQNYPYAGLFPNDPLMGPSGYILEFYSDQTCATPITGGSFYIPQCTQQGLVYRYAINIGTLTTTIKGIGIKTAGFWTHPDAGYTYKIKLWSEAARSDWTHKGNLLLPAVAWSKGAWAEKLAVTAEGTSGYLEVPPTGNVISNGGFEAGSGYVATNWTRNVTDGQWRNDDHNGESCTRSGDYGHGMLRGYNSPTGHILTSSQAAISPNREYVLELYRKTATPTRQWKVTVTCYQSDHTTVTGTFTFPTSGYYSEDGADTWQRFRGTFQSPASTAYCTVAINGAYQVLSGNGLLSFDDVALYPANQASSNCTYLLQTFSQNGLDATTSPMVEFAYCHLGRDRLGVDLYNLMISNPSLASSPSTFADPWRTYTITIVPPDDALSNNVIDDYGDYVSHALLYYRINDGDTKTWSEWTFARALTMATTITHVSAGIDADPVVNGSAVPEVMETNNDYLASARHVCYQGGRVRALTLNWNNTDSEWKYALGEAISSEGKPWAFPTGVAQELLATDGTWSEVRPVTGSEIRGCLATTDDVYIFLDNEFGIERGSDPQTGFRFIRIDSVGLASARSLANARGVVIGLSDDGIFYAYLLSGAQPISKGIIDGSLIDLTKVHDATFADDRYVFLCEYNDTMSLLIYTLSTQSWRMRTSTAFASWKGLASDGVTVYGLDSTGAVYDAFGNGYGAVYSGDNIREVDTQWVQIAPDGYDVQVTGLVIETPKFTNAETVTFTLQGIGKKQTSVLSRTLTLATGVWRYRLACAFLAEAVQVKMTYTGANPPTISFLGIEHDTEPVR